MVFIEIFCLAMRKFLLLKRNLIAKIIMCTLTTLKKPRKSLEEWKEVITLLQSVMVWRRVGTTKLHFSGFRSSSQGQVNLAVAAKEHFRVHLCPNWPSGSPDVNPSDYWLWFELERMACTF
ncbi:unnamed protein product [Nezara viridula]|uniref:Uncharacterized protein n=1 Tax=Nezara viridula TaxID=85310 RepID=A0A9P0HJK5_NEZVI|nr:unnamed protein product [Nezara viridula]